MYWLEQSPDLNPIENVWAVVKRKLIAYENLPNNDELWERIQHEWQALDRGCVIKIKAFGRNIKLAAINDFQQTTQAVQKCPNSEFFFIFY